jgi:pimeloyl-ACP methyl ester carboxylesterase
VPEKTFRPRANKSTNVRLPVRVGFRLLSWAAPRKAETLALDLFATPRRPAASSDPQAEIVGIERHRFSIESGGKRLAAWDWGRGPTVILTHGWSGHSGQMAAFVGPLVRAGYYVVAFDHPAHGQSEGNRATYLEAAAALTAVARRVGPVHAVIGHSFGCTATMLALSRGLPIERAVLVAPPAESLVWARGFGRAIGLTQPRIDGMVDRIRQAVGGDLTALDAARLATSLRARALVVHDEGDREVPFAHGQAIAVAWPGARLEAVRGLGHNRLLRDPHVVQTAVEFVRGRADVARTEELPALSLVR